VSFARAILGERYMRVFAVIFKGNMGRAFREPHFFGDD
jgi:hypothetical protein